MMDPHGMMHYDSRSIPCPQRSVMAPAYVLSPSYSVAPLASNIAAPHFPAPGSYGGYGNSYGHGSGSPTPPFKQHHERPNLRIQAPEPGAGRVMSYPRDSRHAYEAHSPNPSIKSEGQLSTRSSISNPSVAAKNISPNVAINPQHQIDFVTDVDTLMKAIQAKSETEEIVKKAEAEHQAVQSPAPMTPVSQTPTQAKPRKRYTCDVAGCAKSFYQKTHLDIHRRAHTGDKPYVCKQAGCGQRFSQLGNLKTHERRHTGERPYQCEQCGKRFAQRGNVRAHRIVHLQAKPYLCKLDGCNKQFTQLGNLKSHQNKFHAGALKNLTAKFASISDTVDVTEADRELWEYFATLYKNSNKGIKGRGKDRRVGPSSSPKTSTVLSHHPNQKQQEPEAPLHMREAAVPVLPHHQPLHALAHPGNLAAYSMSRSSGAHGPNMIVSMGNVNHGASRDGVHGNYEMFDMDDDHSTGAPSSNGTNMYDEEHNRALGFGERMYA